MARLRNIIIIYTLGLLIGGGIIFPIITSAQVVLLEPIEGYIAEEEAADLGSYLAGIFRLAIGVASGLAVIMIVFGGVQYMTTDSITGKSDGLQKVESAVFGLVVALVAFLVLQTINPALVRFDIVTTLQKVSEELNDRAGDGATSGGTTEPEEGEAWGNDSPVRAQLQAAGIPINKANCATVGQKNCTSVFGLGSPQRLIALFDRCKIANNGVCFSIVTAGTEYWLHTHHGPGSPVVDLLPTGNMNKYVTGSTATPNMDCYEKITKDGVLFQWEAEGCGSGKGKSTGNHWHVKY